MTRCDALTLSSTYSAAHRCLKRTGVRKVGKKNLCTHHRAMKSRRNAPLSCGRRG
jgi:hypothetical protein